MAICCAHFCLKWAKEKDLPGWAPVLVCSWVEQVDSLAVQRQSWVSTGALWGGGACLQQWIPQGLQGNQRMLLQTMRPFSICRPSFCLYYLLWVYSCLGGTYSSLKFMLSRKLKLFRAQMYVFISSTKETSFPLKIRCAKISTAWKENKSFFFNFSHCLFHYRPTLLPRPPPHPIQLTSRKRLHSKQYRHHLMVLGLSKGMFVDGNIQFFAMVGVLFCSFGATLSNWGQDYMIDLSFIWWLHFAFSSKLFRNLSCISLFQIVEFHLIAQQCSRLTSVRSLLAAVVNAALGWLRRKTLSTHTSQDTTQT